ncbi:hypothetical protein L1987_37832 [Smallanthus sonchifolius]|uniref:Uncharacterized protein n=1 Tax=Smallanthus sonchifolius TaxID=185202 RepID=A0ACB9HIP6_9ASTR|nr:hypothetical protein L1987_37832 [Smallanthus sonchifolius]
MEKFHLSRWQTKRERGQAWNAKVSELYGGRRERRGRRRPSVVHKGGDACKGGADGGKQLDRDVARVVTAAGVYRGGTTTEDGRLQAVSAIRRHNDSRCSTMGINGARVMIVTAGTTMGHGDGRMFIGMVYDERNGAGGGAWMNSGSW